MGTPVVRVLFLHPADDPEVGPWADQKWSRVIDLGLAGSGAYSRWRKKFDCPVEPITSLRDGFNEIRRVGEILKLGSGRLLDADGLDWWDLTSVLFHEQIETLVLLKRAAGTLGAEGEVHLTRPGFHADALRALLGARLQTFTGRGSEKGPRHYLRTFSRLPMWQLGQIFWDKYDTGYQIRGRFSPKRRASDTPVVLLPSAYVNVSRTEIAYGSLVPDLKFLLAVTRQSGWMKNLPPNVDAAWLSSYASLEPKRRQSEFVDLMERWHPLRRELQSIPEMSAMFALGCMEVGHLIRQGLEVRDAWRNVFEREPIQAVFCADDSNPHTRIPLLLARKRGLPNVSCHHGALDGRYMIKPSQADTILAKGKMEQDYLVRVCGVPSEHVEVGAPSLSSATRVDSPRGDSSPIVFFSEAYEIFSGRAEEFYRDVLPPLADLAMQTNRELIIKLHPAESHSERSKMAERILSPAQRIRVTVRSGTLTQEFLKQIWLGVTVLSTVAVECSQLGVPCFLCQWLEFWPYGYIDQFTRFGAGYRLKSPAEIRAIPQILETYSLPANVGENVSSPIDPARLEELLTGRTLSATLSQNMDRAV